MSAIWTCVICGTALYLHGMVPCVQPYIGQLVKTKSLVWWATESPTPQRLWQRKDKQLKRGELAIVIKTTNFADWSQEAWFETLIISRYGVGWVASEELIII